MTTVQFTVCDSCGKTVEDSAELPFYIIVGRVNASLRLDICMACFKTSTPELIVREATLRGVVKKEGPE